MEKHDTRRTLRELLFEAEGRLLAGDDPLGYLLRALRALATIDEIDNRVIATL